MGKYVLKRLGLGFITLFLILSVTFILVKLLPFTRPIGGDVQQIAYFEKQYSLGYVYRFDYYDANHEAQYGEALYKSPANSSGRNTYQYSFSSCKSLSLCKGIIILYREHFIINRCIKRIRYESCADALDLMRSGCSF